MDVKLKFYKKNKIGKYVFIINPALCSNTYDYINEKYNKIQSMDEVKFNPIFKGDKKDVYFITFSNTNIYKFTPHNLYDFKIIIKKYNNKFVNIFINSKIIESKVQNFEIL